MSSTKSFAPERFHRHAFVWLEPPGGAFSFGANKGAWASCPHVPHAGECPPKGISAQNGDASPPDDPPEDAEILREWGRLERPLVVRRPCLGNGGMTVCVGLALPPTPHKRRIAFELPVSLVRDVTLPPLWDACAPELGLGPWASRPPSETQAGKMPALLWPVAQIQAAAKAGGCELRTFGSHAWQYLTGLPYVTEFSDIDLLLFVESRTSWSAIRRGLEQLDRASSPRIDLEIVLAGDASFSWREFSTNPDRLLFKGNSRVWLGEPKDIEVLLERGADDA